MIIKNGGTYYEGLYWVKTDEQYQLYECQKVYIVEQVRYGDYEIVAVFLKRQEAALYIATHKKDLNNPFIFKYKTQDGKIHAKADNHVGYIYSGYYTNGNKSTSGHGFIVDRLYDVNFKNTKLEKMQVWLPHPDYDKAKKILTDRYMEEQAELHGLI